MAGSFAGCGVDAASHTALAQRVDLLERRLGAVETAQAKAPEPPAPAPVPEAAPIPELDAKASARDEPLLRVAIGKAGVTIDGKAISDDALDATLKTHAARSDLSGVVIDAEDDVQHATIIALMDRIRASGLDRVAIATKGGTRPE